MQIKRKAQALAFAAVVAAVPALHGQAIYGSLYGTVTDPTGAAIPNATVVVTDVTKGTSDTVTTNESGSYTVEHLIPDTYSIKVTAPGFAGYETTNIRVSADTSPKVDAKLTVGDQGQTVSVTADEIPLLKTDRADVATIFDSKNVGELPLPGRNFTSLQLLLPGAQALGWSHASSENPQGSQQIQIDGQSFAGVGYELDGTDNQDPILGIIVINPTVDSVAEAKITTQNFDAQFGKAVSAVVTTQTKSGSNALHGGFYDFRQSTAQDAKNPFTAPDPVTGKVVPAGLRNQFGAYLGGALQKDRIFYFVDYEGLRSKVGTSNGLLSVPTNLLRSSCAAGACNFSEYYSGGYFSAGPNGALGDIYNPTTGVAFAGHIIPAANLNPAAVRLLLALPAPNITGKVVANRSSIGTGQFNYNEGTARLDFQQSERVHSFIRYSQYQNTLFGATAFGALGGPGFGTGNFGGTSVGRNQSIAAGTDIVVTPKWLTDVRFGYFRYNIVTSKYDGQEAFATNNGIPGLNVSTFANTGGAPEFDFSGFPGDSIGDGGANFGSGLGTNRCNCPLGQNERGYQWVNNWTHELGNHSIKFGVDIRHAYNLRVPSDSNRAGVISFNANQSGTLSGTEGFSYASFAMGRVGQFARYASNTANAYETQNRLFMYVQDVWRFTPKITLNYGLRWENYFPEKTAAGLGASLNIATGNLQVSHQGPYGGNMGVSNAWKAFAPRVGVAYQITPKTVIRAGYGRSFDIGVFGSIFGHNVTQNLPVLAKQQNNSPGGNGAVFILGNTPPAPNFGPAAVNGNIRLPDGIAANGRPTTERFPTIDAWNAEVQRDLGKQYNLTVAYVGNKGTHTFAGNSGNVNLNEIAETQNGFTFNPAPAFLPINQQPSPNTQCVGAPLPNLPCSNVGDNRRRKYYPIYGWTQTLNYFNNGNDTHYNALQASLEKRFSQGYQFKVNYAYQIATNYNQDYVTIDKRVEYGNDDNLRHNQVTFFGNLELPFGHGKKFLNNSGIANEVLGGIQLSPTFNWASGLPFWPGYNGCGNDRDAGPCTPNYNGGSFPLAVTKTKASATTPYAVSFYAKQPTISRTSTGVFTEPNFGTFGNIRRNSFFGPRQFTADLAAQKAFQLFEKYNLLFRTDFYNVFNHIAYANPDTTVDGGNAGQITNLAPGVFPRKIQFAIQMKF